MMAVANITSGCISEPSVAGSSTADAGTGGLPGGQAGSGGRAATGGGASGGATSSGGSTSSGGASGTGGSTGSGGASGTGGSTSSGGASGTGGSTGSGGASNTGGSTGSGGSPGVGGNAGAGGKGGNPPVIGPAPDPATRMRCSGTDPIACHFGGPPGNYDVTVVLGGASAGATIVQAERARAMLATTATTAGQTRRFTFTVNVRDPEGEPIQAVPAGTPGLDLSFLGSAGMPPRLDGIGYAAAASPLVVYLAGDSTVCDQPDKAYGGWGQHIPQFFDTPVSVANYSDSGESSGSFAGSTKLFGAITSRVKANDWVLIQFGHNDKDTTASTFVNNLTGMVTQVKSKGAFPVLVTPIARATFSGNALTSQHVNTTGANLPQLVKQVGMMQNVPVLDLTARTSAWLTELGPNGWQPYFADGTDRTHTNPAGAFVVAGFVRELIRSANLALLSSHLR